MRVNFADKTSKRKRVFLGFSIGYFLLGPIYFLFTGRFLRFIAGSLLYILLLWQGAWPYLASLVDQLNILTQVINNILSFTSAYWRFFFIVLIVLHIFMTIRVPRLKARRLIKKGYMPFSQLDVQKLIKKNLVKIGALSYLDTFGPKDGVGGQIKVKNDRDLMFHLDQLAKLLRDGIISKDEYNEKRAMIIMEK